MMKIAFPSFISQLIDLILNYQCWRIVVIAIFETIRL